MAVETTDCVLTADVCRPGKRGSNIRIEVDHEVTLLSKPFIAVFDLLGDPLPEFVAAQ